MDPECCLTDNDRLDERNGAMKIPQKARKKDRAAKAEKELQDQESTMDGSVGGQRYFKDGQNISYGHEDAWLGAPYGQDNDELPDYELDDLEDPMPGPQVHRMAIDHNNGWQVPSVRGESAEDFENQPFLSSSAHLRQCAPSYHQYRTSPFLTSFQGLVSEIRAALQVCSDSTQGSRQLSRRFQDVSARRTRLPGSLNRNIERYMTQTHQHSHQCTHR